MRAKIWGIAGRGSVTLSDKPLFRDRFNSIQLKIGVALDGRSVRGGARRFVSFYNKF